MVTVIDFKDYPKPGGGRFVFLELLGSIEIQQSQTTGKFFATARKCQIPATFGIQIASRMVGQKIEGEIVRVPCEPYSFENKRTGETITVNHDYAYRPPNAIELIGETKIKELEEA